MCLATLLLASEADLGGHAGADGGGRAEELDDGGIVFDEADLAVERGFAGFGDLHEGAGAGLEAGGQGGGNLGDELHGREIGGDFEEIFDVARDLFARVAAVADEETGGGGGDFAGEVFGFGGFELGGLVGEGLAGLIEGALQGLGARTRGAGSFFGVFEVGAEFAEGGLGGLEGFARGGAFAEELLLALEVARAELVFRAEAGEFGAGAAGLEAGGKKLAFEVGGAGFRAFEIFFRALAIGVERGVLNATEQLPFVDFLAVEHCDGLESAIDGSGHENGFLGP